MIEIATKILICLLISALLGAIIGYFLGRIKKCEKIQKNKKIKKRRKKDDLFDYDQIQSSSKDLLHKEVAVNSPDAIIKPKGSIGIKPIAYPLPKNGVADDLKKIQGIGIKVENALNEVGIFHYSQIAEWSNENIKWIEDYLQSEGRVKRENWIFQAKALMINR